MSKTYIASEKQRVQSATGTKSSNGDNLVLAPPGVGFEYVIDFLSIENATAVTTTWQLKFGGVPVITHTTSQIGNGIEMNFTGSSHELRAGDNNNIILNLSAANAHTFTVLYHIDSTTPQL